MPEAAYDPPVFHDGIWYPTRNTRVSGRLVSVTGVAYEFAPDRVIPHLNLMVPAAGGAGMVIEVHCFPERLLKEVEAVRPREGEDVEISTGGQLVRGFLTYVVSAGGRWSTAEHWAPEDAQAFCSFGAAHLHNRARDSRDAADALANATDLIKPQWPVTVGGSDLFTPEHS